MIKSLGNMYKYIYYVLHTWDTGIRRKKVVNTINAIAQLVYR